MFQSNLTKIAEQNYPFEKDEMIKLAATIPSTFDSFEQRNDHYEQLDKIFFSTVKTSNVWSKVNWDIRISIKLDEDFQVGSFSRRLDGQNKDIACLSLFGSEYVFIKWKTKSVGLYQSDKLFGHIKMDGSRRLFGESLGGFEFSLNYALWPWQASQCIWNDTKISIPANWPDGGNFLKENATKIYQLPEKQRDIIIASMIWRNAVYALSCGLS